MGFDITKKIAFALRLDGHDQVRAGIRGVTDGLYSAHAAASLAAKTLGALVGVGTIVGLAGMVKGSIDATASLHDLAQQTGLSVAALTQFRAIGKLADTSIETIAGATNKLSKGLSMATEEGKGAAMALKAMGIDFDSFRRLDPDAQMLAVAQAMGQFRDGSAKSAAAMLLFGKTGAELLPFLGELADAHDQVAATLGASEIETRRLQAAMSDAFGDNLTKIGRATDSWKKDLSMGLLPALYEASAAVLAMATGTGGLKEKISQLARDGTLADWARGAMTAFSYLLDVGQGLFSLLPMLGTAIAAVAASTSALFGGVVEAVSRLRTGDISGAWDSLRAGFAGVRTVAVAAGQDIAGIWGQQLLGATFRARMADLKGTQAAAAETRGTMTDLSALAAQMATRKDAEAEATRRAAAAERELAAEYKAGVKAAEDAIAAVTKRAESLADQVAAQRRANTQALLGKEAFAQYEAAELLASAATAERNAQLAAAWDLDGRVTAGLLDQAAALRALSAEKARGGEIEAARAAAEEWTKTSDQIRQSLTDSLFRAFEAGKGFFDAFWSTIKHALKTTVLKVGVQAVVGSVTGAFGLSSAANAASAASGSGLGSMLGSGLGSMLGLAGGGGTFGMGLSAGLSGLLGEAGLMGSLSAGSTAIAAGNIMGGLGTIVGALGPIAAGIGAVYSIAKALDNGGTPHMGSAAVANTQGTSTIKTNVAGLRFDHTSKLDQPVAGVATSSAAILNALGAAYGGGSFEVTTGFADDTSKDGAQAALQILRNGAEVAAWRNADGRLSRRELANGDAGWQQYLAAVAGDTKAAISAIGLPEWAAKTLDALGGAPTLETLAAATQQIVATQAALVQFSATVAHAGGVFARIGSMSHTAIMEMAGVVGGLDALQTAAQAYYTAYHSTAERTADATHQVTAALSALGVDALPASRAAYRALVEAQDLGTASGRAMAAQLLALAPAFDQLQTAAADMQAAFAQTVSGITGEIERIRGLQGTGLGAGATLASVQAQFAVASAQARAGSQSAIEALPKLSQHLLEIADNTATSSADVARIQARTLASLQATLAAIAHQQGVQIPGLASGGLFAGGLRIVGEQGPEIEATGPSRVWSAAQTQAMLSGGEQGEMLAELRSLRQSVQQLRDDAQRRDAEMASLQRATVSATAETARILRDVTPTGSALAIAV